MVVTTRTTVAIVTVTAVEALLATTRHVTTILTAVMAVTNVFCSAAVVLPDKAARILNVGGWSSPRCSVSDFMPLTVHQASAPMQENIDTLQLQVRTGIYLYTTYLGAQFTYRVDIGIPLRSFWPMAVSSLWVVRQARTLQPIRTLSIRGGPTTLFLDLAPADRSLSVPSCPS